MRLESLAAALRHSAMPRVLTLLFCWLLLALPLPGAHAQALAPASAGDRIVRIDPVAREGRLYIDADIELDVGGELRRVAERGVPLYFTADLQIVHRRWWWFDKVVIDTRQTWRVMYNVLTRQWRVGSGELSLPAATFDEAMDMLRHIRGWAVADLDELDADTAYTGRLRLRLDTSLMARPFQVDALNSSAWSLSTPWQAFDFSLSFAASRP